MINKININYGLWIFSYNQTKQKINKSLHIDRYTLKCNLGKISTVSLTMQVGTTEPGI